MGCQVLKACLPQEVLLYINLGQCWDCVEFLEIGKIRKSERHSRSNLTQTLASVIHLCQKELFPMATHSAFNFCGFCAVDWECIVCCRDSLMLDYKLKIALVMAQASLGLKPWLKKNTRRAFTDALYVIPLSRKS